MERQNKIIKTSIKGIIVNILLVIFKLIIGFIANSIAIILDAKYNGICLFDYWKRRKRFIQKYSRMFFDNNELDLYYNLEVNKNSLLNELERNGILNQLSHTCRLFSSFHNQYGEEVRAANMLLQQLDNKMLLRIILEGTRICQLSNSYLHNLEEYLRVK